MSEEERLTEIRKRLEAYEGYYPSDPDLRPNALKHCIEDNKFLLSLLDSDSQAVDSDDVRLDAMLKKTGLLHTCHRPHDTGTALERLARNVSDLAATAMRDKCVEKVKDLHSRWKLIADKSHGYDEKYYQGKLDAADDIEAAIASQEIAGNGR